VPIAPAVRALFPDECEQFSLRGGEDYELLLTVPPDRFRDLRHQSARVGATLTVIGQVITATGTADLTLLRNGVAVDSADGAFDHFG
ncbi:MAG: thiamine-phosphate kinase, partial [Chloroflexia bacterium]|nr:thiamine-phosphate kinase [Chloroflexia bacterium]